MMSPLNLLYHHFINLTLLNVRLLLPNPKFQFYQINLHMLLHHHHFLVVLDQMSNHKFIYYIIVNTINCNLTQDLLRILPYLHDFLQYLHIIISILLFYQCIHNQIPHLCYIPFHQLKSDSFNQQLNYMNTFQYRILSIQNVMSKQIDFRQKLIE